MSRTIDERVVEMRFDNKQFEQNVQTSLSTLDKLKQSLNLTGAAKGLENVNSAAKNCNMTPLSNAVETVKVRFSALEVMAITALQNITNSALAAGKNIVSALTIDPIKTGFQEYETQINAVQTILANTSSKGTTLDQVNAALDELNRYADMTIYNFTEMTRNIGTFTAAGVDLDTSVSAIKGIANLAAVSGSTSQQASTAMYQLSQALAAGTVKLQDWNSVVNAGMGGQVFQDALKETARVHGVAIDQMIEDEGSFRETLSKGWLTSDILTETLAKFTGDLNEDQLRTMGYTEEQIESIIKMGQTANDAATKVKTFTQLFDTLKEAAQSGWTQSWEIIVGDFEEAKELLTEMSDTFSGIINSSAEARNAMLQEWKDLGGRTAMIDAARNVFEGLLSILTPIKEAFREIFPPMTGKQLAEITEKVRDLTEKFKIGDETSKNLKNTFKGVFAVLDIVAQAFKTVAGGIADLIGFFLPAGNGILGLTGNFGEYLTKLDDTIKKTDLFHIAIQKVVDFIKSGVTIASNVLKAAGEAVKDFGKFISEKFDFPGFEMFHSFLERIQSRMSQVGDAAGNMKSGVTTAFELMGEALENCKFLEILQTLWKAVKSIVGGIVGAVGDLAETLVDKLGNADFSGILDLLNGVATGGIAVAISKFLKNVSEPLEGLEGMLKGVTNILDSVRGCFEAYQTQLKAGTLLKIASAIAILAAAIVAIALVDSDKLAASLAAISVLFVELIGAMAIFDKLGGATGKGTSKLIVFASAILILSSAVKKLADLSWEQLATGLVGVGVLLAEIDVFMATAKFSKGATSTATGIVILASAMKILASACKDFGEMKWEEIGKGLTSVGVLLAEIAVFTKLTGNAKHVISSGLALIEIAAAMKIFASAMDDFARFSWEQIAKGLVSIGVALAEVAVATKLMPKNMVGIGTGLVIVGASLEIVADALSKMGNFSWEQIAKGLVTMGVALAELAIGLNAMKGTLSGSAAMLVAASALAILTPVLSILGAMSWTSIAKGLVSIAGAFTVLGVAGAVLTPLVPTILGLAGAFTLIGVGVLGIGAGLLAAGTGLSAIAVGFTALATAGAAGATAIVASLTVIVTGIAGLIPAVVAKIGEAIITFCQVIADGAPAIGEAIKAVVLTLVDVLVECVPAIADGALRLIAGVLDALANYTPQIVDSIFQFLINVLEGIANNLPALIQAAINVLMSFFSGIADALSGIDVDTLLKGIVGIGLLSAIMVALGAVASLVPSAMVGVLGMGVVIAELALVLAAVGGLAQIPGLQWLIGEGGKLLEGIGTAIGQFVGGIVGGFMSGVSSQFPQIGADLSAFMTNIQPFIEGASRIDASMMDGVKALAETILILTAADILQGLTSWIAGGSSLSEFATELVPFGNAMKDFSVAIAGMDANVVANAATAGKTLAEMAATLPNTGGVVGFFAGNNDMDTFGEQLVPFGEAMKAYSDAIAGIDVEAVTNSATAGKAIVELANTLPNTGGLVSWFTGDNDMSEFGEQLVLFGEDFAQYSDYMKNVDAGIVTATTNAATSIVELQKSLPKEGGWFSDDMTLSSFGSDMASFGSYFGSFYNYISGVDTGQLSSVISQTNRLVSMAKGMTDLDTSGMSGFSSALTALGQAGIDGFINAFNNANARVSTAVSNMLTTFIGAANAKKTSLTTTFTSLVQAVLTAINNKQPQFNTAGNALMIKFIAGVRAKDADTRIAFTSSLGGAVSAIKDYYSKFYDAGSYLVDGFCKGINNNDYKAAAKAKAMARKAAEAAAKELDEHSPSKVGYRIGDYFGLAFVNAIDDYADRSYDAGSGIAEAAKNGLSKAASKVADFIANGIDTEPTIRPVLDLSNVEAGTGRLNAMLSRSQAMTINSRMSQPDEYDVQNENISAKNGSTFNFTQNNYSPKALSRVEIYRQTKNQFSAMERMVET